MKTAGRCTENSHYNFLLRYPADQWSHYEPIDGNGVVLALRDQSRFHLPPQIRVGGGVGQPSDADESRNETLEEDFQAGLNSLNEYGHAKNVTVLSKTAAKVEGRSAIASTIRYEDSATHTVWFHKEVLIHSNGDSPRYFLELRCAPEDVPALVPLFDRVFKTFRILGPPA